MRSFFLALLPLLGALPIATTGCAAGSGSSPYHSVPGRRVATVEIENNNWADVSVFAVRYGDWRRLGTVTSMTTARFRLPGSWVERAEPVAIRIELIGSNAVYRSQEVPLEPGATLVVSVKNRLPSTHLYIR